MNMFNKNKELSYPFSDIENHIRNSLDRIQKKYEYPTLLLHCVQEGDKFYAFLDNGGLNLNTYYVADTREKVFVDMLNDLALKFYLFRRL